jgi:allantoinase
MPFWDIVETNTGPKPMVITPYAIDTNDMKMWVAPALQPWDWARYAIESFDALLKEARAGEARVLNFGLHLRIVGRPGRIGALEQVLAHFKKHEDEVFIGSRGSMVEAFIRQTIVA